MSEKKVIIRLDDSDNTESSILEYISEIPRHRRQEHLRRILWLGICIENKTLTGRGKGRPSVSTAPKPSSGRQPQSDLVKKIKQQEKELSKKEEDNHTVQEIIELPITNVMSVVGNADYEMSNSNSLQGNDDNVQSDIVESNSHEEYKDVEDDLSDLRGMF